MELIAAQYRDRTRVLQAKLFVPVYEKHFHNNIRIKQNHGSVKIEIVIIIKIVNSSHAPREFKSVKLTMLLLNF